MDGILTVVRACPETHLDYSNDLPWFVAGFDFLSNEFCVFFPKAYLNTGLRVYSPKACFL
jgi:hypothetical protein